MLQITEKALSQKAYKQTRLHTILSYEILKEGTESHIQAYI